MATSKKSTSKNTTTDNVVGINIAKISNMTSAIDTYVDAIKKNVEIAVSVPNIQKGIKGTNSVNTLHQLGTEVNNRVKSYLKELTDLKTKLTELKSQYSKLDSENTIFSNKAKSISK